MTEMDLRCKRNCIRLTVVLSTLVLSNAESACNESHIPEFPAFPILEIPENCLEIQQIVNDIDQANGGTTFEERMILLRQWNSTREEICVHGRLPGIPVPTTTQIETSPGSTSTDEASTPVITSTTNKNVSDPDFTKEEPVALSTSSIIGIIIGVVAVVLIVLIAAIVYFRHLSHTQIYDGKTGDHNGSGEGYINEGADISSSHPDLTEQYEMSEGTQNIPGSADLVRYSEIQESTIDDTATQQTPHSTNHNTKTEGEASPSYIYVSSRAGNSFDYSVSETYSVVPRLPLIPLSPLQQFTYDNPAFNQTEDAVAQKKLKQSDSQAPKGTEEGRRRMSQPDVVLDHVNPFTDKDGSIKTPLVARQRSYSQPEDGDIKNPSFARQRSYSQPQVMDISEFLPSSDDDEASNLDSNLIHSDDNQDYNSRTRSRKVSDPDTSSLPRRLGKQPLWGENDSTHVPPAGGKVRYTTKTVAYF